MDCLPPELQTRILSFVDGRSYLSYAYTSKTNYTKLNTIIADVQREAGLDFPIKNAAFYFYFYSKHYLTADTQRFTPRIETLVRRTAKKGLLSEVELEILRNYKGSHFIWDAEVSLTTEILLWDVARILNRPELEPNLTKKLNMYDVKQHICSNFIPKLLREGVAYAIFKDAMEEGFAAGKNDITWFQQNTATQPEACIRYTCRKNRHDLLFILLQKYKVKANKVLYGKSDARTTAMVLSSTNECDIRKLRNISYGFIQIDNSKSLDICLKYIKARIDNDAFNRLFNDLIVYTVCCDSVSCFGVLMEYNCDFVGIMKNTINTLVLESIHHGIREFYNIKPTFATRILSFVKSLTC